MSQKQKSREKDKRVGETEALMAKLPEPAALRGLMRAARPLVEYEDQGDGTLVGWCPATILVRLNLATKTVTHLFAHTETPPPDGDKPTEPKLIHPNKTLEIPR